VKLAGLSLYRYELPLSEPVRLNETTLRHREGLLVELASDGGAAGWGEAAPLPGFSHEGLDEALVQLRHLADSMVGREATVDPEGAFARELDTLDLVPSARFGFELALWDLYAASSGKALPELVTSRPRTTVPINALISSPDHAIEEALRARAAGYEAVKLKVGGRDVEEDVELVRAVRGTLNSDVSLRLDANRAWSFEEAERFARGIAGLRLEYVEEPLSDPVGLTSLSHLRPAGGAGRVAGFHATGGAGGSRLRAGRRAQADAARRHLADAARLGMRPVISSAYETGAGTSCLVALAAGVGDEEVPAGLDTYRRLDEDVLRPRLELAPRVDIRVLFDERREIEHRLLRSVG
jgi:o-succinylbenzoate synthase